MKEIKFIIVKIGFGFKLYACRGEGKGCKKNYWRKRKTHCADCLLADPKETLEQFEKRLLRGDA